MQSNNLKVPQRVCYNCNNINDRDNSSLSTIAFNEGKTRQIVTEEDKIVSSWKEYFEAWLEAEKESRDEDQVHEKEQEEEKRSQEQ